MPKPKKTADQTIVTFLLDRSGSMSSIKADTIGGFNAYLDTLKAPGAGTITFSFLQFDSQSIDIVFKNEPIANVPHLNADTFQPRATTPLIDACVKTIKVVEEHLAKRDGKPKVVVCFQTDGYENASTAHTWDELNALIKAKTAEGWQFNFMGAGIDAYATGARMGVLSQNTMSYDSFLPQATRAAFSATAHNTQMFASGLSNSTGYTAGQRAGFGDKFAGNRFSKPAKKPDAKVKSQSLADDVSL